MNDMSAVIGCGLAAAAEAMYPSFDALPDDIAKDWTLVKLLTAQDWTGCARVYIAFLVVSKHDPMLYALVFRGTENALEWLRDFEARMYYSRWGRVHFGFWSVWKTVLPINTDIGAVIPKGARVCCIGHSLGAPLACLQALAMSRDVIGITVSGLFFAMPRLGDSMFAAKFIASVPDYRVYNYARDLVPDAPLTIPPLFDYRPLPNITIIPASDLIPDDPKHNHVADDYLKLLTA